MGNIETSAPVREVPSQSAQREITFTKNKFIYILALESNKYYVGKTTNPDIRLDTHFEKAGSYWTVTYKPIRIIQIVPDCDDYDEDKYTLRCMELFGVGNIRGGSFSEFVLDKQKLKFIESILDATNDRCFICKSTLHFAHDCPTVKGSLKGEVSLISKREATLNLLKVKVSCERCKRENHTTEKCYASTYADGTPIKKDTFDLKIRTT